MRKCLLTYKPIASLRVLDASSKEFILDAIEGGLRSISERAMSNFLGHREGNDLSQDRCHCCWLALQFGMVLLDHGPHFILIIGPNNGHVGFQDNHGRSERGANHC